MNAQQHSHTPNPRLVITTVQLCEATSQVTFQDLDRSLPQKDPYHCQQLTCSALYRFSLSVTHTDTHKLTILHPPLCVSAFHSTEMIYFVSPLSSSSPQPPSGSAPNSITLSGFLIPALETPVPIQESNRLKNAAQAPSISPFSPSVSASLCPRNR